MFCYVRTGFKLFDISFMFLFSRFEGSAGLTYIVPGTVYAIDLVYDVSLFFRKWSILWVTGNVVLKYGVVSLWF